MRISYCWLALLALSVRLCLVDSHREHFIRSYRKPSDDGYDKDYRPKYYRPKYYKPSYERRKDDDYKVYDKKGDDDKGYAPVHKKFYGKKGYKHDGYDDKGYAPVHKKFYGKKGYKDDSYDDKGYAPVHKKFYDKKGYKDDYEEKGYAPVHKKFYDKKGYKDDYEEKGYDDKGYETKKITGKKSHDKIRVPSFPKRSGFDKLSYDGDADFFGYSLDDFADLFSDYYLNDDLFDDFDLLNLYGFDDYDPYGSDYDYDEVIEEEYDDYGKPHVVSRYLEDPKSSVSKLLFKAPKNKYV